MQITQANSNLQTVTFCSNSPAGPECTDRDAAYVLDGLLSNERDRRKPLITNPRSLTADFAIINLRKQLTQEQLRFD